MKTSRAAMIVCSSFLFGLAPLATGCDRDGDESAQAEIATHQEPAAAKAVPVAESAEVEPQEPRPDEVQTGCPTDGLFRAVASREGDLFVLDRLITMDREAARELQQSGTGYAPVKHQLSREEAAQWEYSLTDDPIWLFGLEDTTGCPATLAEPYVIGSWSDEPGLQLAGRIAKTDCPEGSRFVALQISALPEHCQVSTIISREHLERGPSEHVPPQVARLYQTHTGESEQPRCGEFEFPERHQRCEMDWQWFEQPIAEGRDLVHGAAIELHKASEEEHHECGEHFAMRWEGPLFLRSEDGNEELFHNIPSAIHRFGTEAEVFALGFRTNQRLIGNVRFDEHGEILERRVDEVAGLHEEEPTFVEALSYRYSCL